MIWAALVLAPYANHSNNWRTYDECEPCTYSVGMETQESDIKWEERLCPETTPRNWTLYITPEPGWTVHMVFLEFDSYNWCMETRMNGGRIERNLWRYTIGDFDNCEAEMLDRHSSPPTIKIRVWYVKQSSPDCRYEPDTSVP